MRIPSIQALSAVLPLLAAVAAQDPADLQERGTTALPEVFPLHSHPEDPSYGTWGAGRGFKARFAADRVSFHPYVAEDREAVQLDWSTAWIGFERDGEAPRAIWTAGDAATVHTAPRDYTVHRASVVENWELRADGLAQTFHFSRRPVGEGDLVLRGRVTGTGLHPTEAGLAHQTLVFANDAGTATVRYGEAFLVDASGTQFPLRTSLDAATGKLELRVPEALRTRAIWPFYIDPILSTTNVAGGLANRTLRVTSVAAMPGSGTRLLTTTRRFGTDDFDLAAFLIDASGNVSVAFSDLGDSTSAFDPSAVYVAGARRYVVAYQSTNRQGSPTSRIRVARIPENATSPNQSVATTLPPLAGSGQDDQPSISGSLAAGQTIALVARSTPNIIYDRDATNGRIRGLWMNAATGQVNRSPFLLTPGLLQGYAEPAAMPVRDDDQDQFLYSYIRESGNATTSVHLRRQLFDGTLSSEITLVPATQGGADRVHVAGGLGQYCVVSSGSVNSAATAHRFAWRSSDPAPTALRTNRLSTTTVASLAFDHGSTSHWLAAGNRAPGSLVDRLGWNGQVMSTEPITPVGDGAKLAWTGEARFAAGYLVRGQSNLFVDAVLGDYGYPAARFVPIGSGCGRFATVRTSRPTAGDHFFSVSMSTPFRGASCVLLIGFAQAAIPLDLFGFPGCTLWVDPTGVIDVGPFVTPASGDVSTTIPLDDIGPLDAYMQWLILPPGLASYASTGVRVEIR